jgi:hypothetical protein
MTLLHEMIHAYLFSMSGNKDHEYNDFCPSCLLQKQPFWLPCFPVCICLALLSGFLSLTLFSRGPLVMCDSDHGPCFQHLMRSINQCSADDDQVLLTTFMMSSQCLISNKECLSHKPPFFIIPCPNKHFALWMQRPENGYNISICHNLEEDADVNQVHHSKVKGLTVFLCIDGKVQ